MNIWLFLFLVEGFGLIFEVLNAITYLYFCKWDLTCSELRPKFGFNSIIAACNCLGLGVSSSNNGEEKNI